MFLETAEGTGEVKAARQVALCRSADGRLPADACQPRRAGAGRAESGACLPDFVDQDASAGGHARRHAA